MKYLSELNWISILIATVVGFLLGGLWFSPMLFSKKWRAAMGQVKEEPGGGMGPALALSFVVTFATATGLALLLDLMPLTTTLGALRLGLTVGIVFYALNTASDFAFTGWPRTVYWIQASYHVLQIALMSLIVAYWR